MPTAVIPSSANAFFKRSAAVAPFGIVTVFESHSVSLSETTDKPTDMFDFSLLPPSSIDTSSGRSTSPLSFDSKGLDSR